MSSLFWQRFLAMELPHAKAQALLRELGPSLPEPDRFVPTSRLLTPKEKERWAKADLLAGEKALARGIEVWPESAFPERLCEAEIAPALFAWGSPAPLLGRTVGIVGTRAASPYGKAVALKFAEVLARAGVCIVSGGALGVDAAAHQGALTAGGRTVAVLAGGVDRVYPPLHAGLFERIRERGCLLSQFPLGSSPSGYRFLVRNRLVAGLSDALLVVEAPERSGALATVNAALEMGRPVFVVPANIDNLNFAGSHALIREGATLADHPGLILETLGLEFVLQEAVPEPEGESGQTILALLSTAPLPPESIAERTGIPMRDLLSELTVLELEGQIRREEGGFVKAL